MERKDYIIIILVIALVGIVSFSSAYLLASQPKNNSTNNSLNSSNNSNNTQQSINQSAQQSTQKTTKSNISSQEAIRIAKGTLHDSSQTHAYATYSDTGAFPYYEVEIIDDNTKHSTYGQKIFTVTINAQTGEVLDVT